MNPAPLDYNIGKGIEKISYSNLVLKPEGGSSWRHPPSQNTLIEGPIYAPQGTPFPLKHEAKTQEPPKDSMFMFVRNKTSMECCPSTYTTSTGCVCTTKDQRHYVGNARGTNVNYSNYPGI